MKNALKTVTWLFAMRIYDHILSYVQGETYICNKVFTISLPEYLGNGVMLSSIFLYVYILTVIPCLMPNTHISVKVLELLKDIRNLEGALEKKNRTELDGMLSSAVSSLNWIQDQARDNNADLSPYFSQLDQADIDLNRLKSSIAEKDRTIWEAVAGIF